MKQSNTSPVRSNGCVGSLDYYAFRWVTSMCPNYSFRGLVVLFAPRIVVLYSISTHKNTPALIAPICQRTGIVSDIYVYPISKPLSPGHYRVYSYSSFLKGWLKQSKTRKTHLLSRPSRLTMNILRPFTHIRKVAMTNPRQTSLFPRLIFNLFDIFLPTHQLLFSLL